MFFHAQEGRITSLWCPFNAFFQDRQSLKVNCPFKVSTIAIDIQMQHQTNQCVAFDKSPWNFREQQIKVLLNQYSHVSNPNSL